MLSVAGLVVCLILLMVFKLILSWRVTPLKNMKSPEGKPLVGNAFQISPDKPHFTFTDWGKTLGDIYFVRIFRKNMVVLSGFNTIHEALVEKGPEFAGRPRGYRIGCITNNFQNIGFCNPSRPWWLLRRIAHRQLKAYGEGLQKLEDITADLLAEMKREIISECESGPVDIRSSLYSATMSIICAFLVGERYQRTDEEFLLFREMERLGIRLIASAGKGAELDAFPWLRHFGNDTYKQISKFMTLRDNLYNKLRDRVLQNKEGEERSGCDGILAEIIRAANDPESQKRISSPYDADKGKFNPQADVAFNEEYAKGTFVDLILAGTASTTNLVYAFINLMLHYPDVYENIQEEISAVQERKISENDQGRGNNNEEFRMSLADRPSMPYVQAAILELLRFVSIAPFTVPHVALEDSTLGGYEIPKGTEVLCNLWALHHDETLWENPWEFCPERFLEGSKDQGYSVVASDHPNRRHLMAFGGGPRRCTGENFALNRLFLVLTSILKDLHFSVDPNRGLVSIDPHTYELGIAFYPLDFTTLVRPTKYYKDGSYKVTH